MNPESNLVLRPATLLKTRRCGERATSVRAPPPEAPSTSSPKWVALLSLSLSLYCCHCLFSVLLSLSFPCVIVLGFVFVLLSLSFICVAVIVFAIFVHSLYDCILVLRQADLDHQDLCHQNRVDVCIANNDRGKIKAVCCDLGHCSLLFKSDPNAVYSPPNAVY